MTRTLVAVLGSTFATAVGLSLAGLADTVVGWAALTLAALIGLSPVPWFRLRARQARHRLPVWDLDPPLARLVARAADEAAVLGRLADRAPEGPVADHLDHLSVTAQGYVIALHQAAVQSRTAAGPDGRRDLELEATMERVVAELGDLAAAAARLREAQRRHLENSPLRELTEATDRLTATMASEPFR